MVINVFMNEIIGNIGPIDEAFNQALVARKEIFSLIKTQEQAEMVTSAITDYVDDMREKYPDIDPSQVRSYHALTGSGISEFMTKFLQIKHSDYPGEDSVLKFMAGLKKKLLGPETENV